MADLAALQEEAFKIATANGFHLVEEEPDITVFEICQALLMIHSEVTEAMNVLREGCLDNSLEDLFFRQENGKPVGLSSELADIILRTLDLAACLGIDMQTAVEEKMTYNRTRAFRHDRAF